MSKTISGSVGAGGRNAASDVVIVQQLLLLHGFKIGLADGICGARTIRAITSFQHGFITHPDGRVDPDGLTWRHLSGISPHQASLHQDSPFTRPVPRPPVSSFNSGLQAATTRFMKEKLGEPRDSYGQDCQPITNAKLKRNIITSQVGQIRVTGLAPAVRSLQLVFAEIASKQPDLYAIIGTAGMLCCRYVRGSNTAISNHSWGTAVDLTLNGILDKRGDGQVQYGLTLIAPIFNQHQWYWGAGFPTEDAMHFEGSRSLIEVWAPQLA
jgi:D-alanyl-D-alanine carboxypeptidase/Putative peptidoglycan binding domain